MNPLGRLGDRGTLVYAVLFAFGLQLLTEFVEGIYAFGLMGTSIPLELVSILLLFTPILLLVLRAPKHWISLALVSLVFSSRLIAVMLDTRGRMLLSGVGFAALLIWLPLSLWRIGQHKDSRWRRQELTRLVVGLTLAAQLLASFRILGSGLDLTTRGPSQVLGWLMAAGAGFLLVRGRATEGSPFPVRVATVGPEETVSLGQLVLLALGLSSVLVLLYFAFTSPNVVARWTGMNYLALVITMAVAWWIFVGLSASRLADLLTRRREVVWAVNGLFVLSLVATLRVHQVRFPAGPGSYPFYVPEASAVQHIPLFLMLLLSPALFLDFALYTRSIVAARPSLRALGGAFTVSSLYWVAMVFAHVFTTVYDYIPVVGPAFRDQFWLVHLILGLGLVLPLAAVPRKLYSWHLPPTWGKAVALMALLAPVAVMVTMARPQEALSQASVTVLTYNVQQGYSENGQRSVEEQLALMRDIDPDIIGLQESDTNRIAGGNSDIVRYYADRLDMYSYYGPKTTVGTFGIALLSKYPIVSPRTFYMYSDGEQTATIEAQITVGDASYRVFVTHLGNGGPIVQQAAILEEVGNKEQVILVGDFNFRPNTDQYALTVSMLDDAWRRRWPDGGENPGVQLSERIDHIFVSPDVQVQHIRYVDSPASDHPAVYAVIQP
jgi:endonuclease/exonuclease/phosphatase family metal-dependent hydrolase